MIDPKMEKALNDQIQAEMYSAYFYLSMAAFFEDRNLPGFSNWFRVQYEEEFFHAMKFFDFVCERGGRVQLGTINGPPGEWDSPLAVYEAAFEHEQMVTGLVDDLMNRAIELRDHATRSFLQWFVDEQVEEEANVDAIVQQLKLIGDSGYGLYQLDKELAGRTFTPPV